VLSRRVITRRDDPQTLDTDALSGASESAPRHRLGRRMKTDVEVDELQVRVIGKEEGYDTTQFTAPDNTYLGDATPIDTSYYICICTFVRFRRQLAIAGSWRLCLL
jgi:hypothetical protein